MELLRLEHISKSFSGVTVLDDVGFDLRAGEVHALIGENGAGKSTLMNIVGGACRADGGQVYWNGRPVEIRSPREAQDLGINFVHQEVTLVPQLSVGENIFLGRHPAARGWVRWGEIHGRARKLLEELGHAIDPRRAAGELSIAGQQLVEIARALAFEARLIIMDEPTAPLSEHETARLFQTIARLKTKGVSVIYISHRLKEIYRGPDRVTVLRDGRRITTLPVAQTDTAQLVRHMVGREIARQGQNYEARPLGGEGLRLDGLTARGEFHDIHLGVRRGEIVGLAGLAGAGRTELVESLFGAGERDGGTVYLNGRPVKITTPADAVRQRIALVSDDRKAKGLVLGASIRFNIAIAAQRQLLLNAAREKSAAERLMRELRIKARDDEQLVMYLSGGNQQKVVLAKWLFADAEVYVFDEPTRGVDVGSKAEIHDAIRRLAENGAAILLVSSELEEILHLADRVVVMHRGRIAGELRREEASEETIMHLATGGAAR